MIKIIGTMFMVFAGILGGMRASEKYKLRINFWQEFMEMTLMFKNEIKFSEKPPKKILNDFNCGEPMKFYINKCKASLNEGYPFPQAWVHAFDSCSKQIGINLREQNVVQNFGFKLGSGDINGQLLHCDYNLELIKPFLNKAREIEKSRGKLSVILGLCLSAGAALILA